MIPSSVDYYWDKRAIIDQTQISKLFFEEFISIVQSLRYESAYGV